MAADKLISSGGPWESVIGYSRATVAGDYVHVSGSTATVDGVLQHEGDAYGQTKVALENVIAGALAQVGYTLADVVRSRVYLSNAEDMDAVGKAHGEIQRCLSKSKSTLGREITKWRKLRASVSCKNSSSRVANSLA
jgi:enamine deaminase RidA (YjgF/YER057c/UK114 family)